MTKLTKRVRRGVEAGRRRYVVALLPGEPAMIEVREHRRRAGFSVTVEGLYYILAGRAVEVARSRRRRRR